MRVWAPWAAGIWGKVNGLHPLPVSLLADGDQIQFDRTVTTPIDASSAEQVLFDRLSSADHTIDRRAIGYFVKTRSIGDQGSAPLDASCTFVHTLPMVSAERAFAIHLEEIGTLYWRLHSAADPTTDLAGSPFTACIKSFLELDECRLILSHIKHTVDWLPRAFESDQIAAKVRYVPLGCDFVTPDSIKESSQTPTFLFTNSWQRSPTTFLARGALEAIESFTIFSRERPGSSLYLVSPMPDDPNLRSWIDQRRNTPGLHFIETTISDDELHALYAQSHAFLLPSLWLHSYSLIRAMALGAIPIVCNGPGYEEFIAPDETAICVERSVGRRWYDDRGIMRWNMLVPSNSDYHVDTHLVGDILSAMRRIADDLQFQSRLRENCATAIRTRHRLETWRSDFRWSLRRAVVS